MSRARELASRAMRGSAFIAAGYGASQALRLASNLILTRLLFPEAFGLMALVLVFIVGLTMFSDVGLGPSIMQSARGDDPVFLDTAWTIQLGRGVLLWLACCVIAWPAALFYEAPQLAQLLPAAGLQMLIAGFNPTRIDTAHRHLLLGRVTMLDLTSQVVGIAVMIGAAMATGSVWSLVIGALAAAVVKLWLTWTRLPGHRNRLRWDAGAASELIRFGKWIFLSTACGFLLLQGDKAILGRYLALDALGIYNIGYFLGSFPFLLGIAIISRVLIPIYRGTRENPSPEGWRRLSLMRFALTGGTFVVLGGLALGGVPLIGFLYDPRYALAGGILVLVACIHFPLVVGLTYDQAALAGGDSKRFFYLTALRAVVQTLAFLAGVHFGGLVWALAAQGLASVAVYPATVWLARRHGVWDGPHDAIYGMLGLGIVALAVTVNAEALAVLAVAF